MSDTTTNTNINPLSDTIPTTPAAPQGGQNAQTSAAEWMIQELHRRMQEAGFPAQAPLTAPPQQPAN